MEVWMKRKLNYRFHNPNSEEATINQVLQILVEVNEQKVQKAIEEALNERVETKSA